MVSAFALGWTVYRDAIAKPRLGVKCGVGRDGSTDAPVLVLSVVNYGPGKVRCEYGVVRVKPLGVARVVRRGRNRVITPVEGNQPYADVLFRRAYGNVPGRRFDKLPFFLEPAERAWVAFPESNLDQSAYQVGVRDSYGRFHWAPKRDTRGARANCDELKRRLEEDPF